MLLIWVGGQSFLSVDAAHHPKDTIDVSNLNRQFLFRQSDVGKSKAECAAKFVEKRVKGVSITPHNCKIQDKDEDFYMQFTLVICGLDSIEARRWINSTLVDLVDEENQDSLKPLIDGGTEGMSFDLGYGKGWS
jgi:ubiquitin-activating enzyme E1 C